MWVMIWFFDSERSVLTEKDTENKGRRKSHTLKWNAIQCIDERERGGTTPTLSNHTCAMSLVTTISMSLVIDPWHPILNGYFKICNTLYWIILYTSLFTCKIYEKLLVAPYVSLTVFHLTKKQITKHFSFFSLTASHNIFFILPHKQPQEDKV